MKRTFEVGHQEKHQVEVEITATGKEVYRVDGEVVLSLRSFKSKAERTFTVGTEEQHEVRIVLDSNLSLKSLIDPSNWKAQVFVDGELFIDDLTPELRDTVKTVNSIMNWIIVISVVVIVVCYVAAKLLEA